MQKDSKTPDEALDELKKLVAELKLFLGFQCDVFSAGCYECNVTGCPNHAVICSLAWEAGEIFLDTGIKPAEEMLLIFLKSRNNGLKLRGLHALEKARTSGKFLTLKALLELDRFKRNVVNWHICEQVDSFLKAEKAYLN